MRRAISYSELLIFCGVVAVAAYFYRSEVRTFAVQALFQVAPCSMPVTYSIGTIDPRFGMSTSSLEGAMEAATGVWDDAASKQLFAYQPSGGLVTVNLIYDERQATTERLDSIGGELADHADSYGTVKERYSAALSEYETRRAAFESSYASYAARARAYESEVREWNAQGGAPESRYEALRDEKEALERDARALEAMQREVNDRADAVNALVRELNALASEVNADAAEYTSVGRVTGAEFEEAVFISAPGREEINVYEYDSRSRLIRVLAHEFGHSLGLEHVQDPDAIMYRLNQGNDTRTTADDREELDAVCRL